MRQSVSDVLTDDPSHQESQCLGKIRRLTLEYGTDGALR